MSSLYSKEHVFRLSLLFCFCLLIYSDIFNNGWHLDDSGNILNNTPLHITDLNLDTLFNTFYAHPEETGRLYRPVANFTFALNWFFGQDSPVGYHLVDIFIHGLTAIMLFFCSSLLLSTPALKQHQRTQTQKNDIALLTAALWLAAPIHTSAVTYIVQRMAQLAALFSIGAIFFYLSARLSHRRLHQALFFCSFFCCALLALGSKENAALLFPSLALIEGIFFFQFARIQKFAFQKKKLFLLISLLFSGGIFFLSWDFIIAQANSYGHRNFTFHERILTEPRILLFYLSQIFYPTASRLSIAHDITLSSSLFTPWQTVPAILSCMALMVLAIVQINKRPLFSFAILYYFLNHLVESTIIPLELIFEHRNLLPSLFLFLPLAAFAVDIINTKTWRIIITALTCSFFLIQSGQATIERNKTWKNEGTLNKDALKKAPGSARVKLNLAGWYAGLKKYQEALNLCEEAEQFEKNDASRNTIIPIARMQKGTITYQLGQPEKALEYFRQAYSLRKDYTAAAEKLIAVLIELERYDEALDIIAERYKKTNDSKLFLLKASVLLRQKKAGEALACYRRAEPFYPNLPLITAGIGKALILQGNHSEATLLFTRAVQQQEPIVKLLLIENNLLSGKKQEASAQLNELIRTVPLVRLLNDLNAPRKDPFQIPVNTPLLRRAILHNASLMISSSTLKETTL
ncbi:MAG: tetratricopeptide repeat protein [Candidatus Electrothrix scaldis]|nr:MAG: tetratricopeptide repeat protein [Candidatus Electrothrix sp. GW3-3]